MINSQGERLPSGVHKFPIAFLEASLFRLSSVGSFVHI